MQHDLKLSPNIYKDAKRGTYYFRITYYDKTNTRQFITRKGFKQCKEAVIKCNEIMDEIEGIGKINKLPFYKLVEEYIDWYSARRKASSLKSLKIHANNHLIPYFKSMDVFNMTTQDVMKFQNKKMKEGRSGEYLKKMHVFLVSILNHAMKYHDLGRNVASLVGNYEIETKKRLNYWTLEQFNQFYEALPSIQQKLFFKLLFYSGARKGEIRALKWEDVNFDDDYIHINKTDYHGEVTAPKTKAATRDIYLPTHMMDDLRKYLIWYKENNIYKENYVLFGTFFKALNESTIDRWFTSTLKVLDETLPDGETFPRIVIHELRHSHASMLVNHGASPMIIAQRLGHSSTEEVTSRYGHLYPSTQKEIIKYL
ncbi:site-specific integrase [Staphylococcus xylosus]|uniref:Site-specific integrase n=1 Tax=Staphylococcus xylosus TaxID=1288 RepID=A0A5R9B3S0_STAXY|nr:site-specific integrase [Staphylococcus xylosus]MEB6297566.1 site-specific integrase [Staphylococcus xylosus]TLP91007.1 site-specific integrase [Staphylococcus xylosus]